MTTLSWNDGAIIAITAGEALEPYRRVMLNSSGQAVYADAADESIGVTVNRAASGDAADVKLWSGPGTYPVTASEAISAINTQLYGADDGKVKDTAGGEPLGVCRQTASGNNSQIEMVMSRITPVGLPVLHTVGATEDSGNSAAVDTGLGSAVVGAIVATRTSAGVERAGNTVTISAGVVTVANSNLAATDVITVIPLLLASTSTGS